MSETTFQMLMAELERVEREYDTPEKARALLQEEGLLDENGKTAAIYSAHEELICR